MRTFVDPTISKRSGNLYQHGRADTSPWPRMALAKANRPIALDGYAPMSGSQAAEGLINIAGRFFTSQCAPRLRMQGVQRIALDLIKRMRRLRLGTAAERTVRTETPIHCLTVFMPGPAAYEREF